MWEGGFGRGGLGEAIVALFVVTASNLHPVTSGNSSLKFSDDTYLIVRYKLPMSCRVVLRSRSGQSITISHFNRSNSVELVFVSLCSKRSLIIPRPAVPCFVRTESIKALGIIISRCFSITEQSACILYVTTVCIAYSAASRSADQCTACNFPNNSGRQAVFCLTCLLEVRQCR